ncbi:MAG: glycosyltransferase 87 family protein [Acidimicrobiales bacterium]
MALLTTLAVVMWTFVALSFARRAAGGLPLDLQVYRDASLTMLHGGAAYHSRYTFAHLNFTYPPIGLVLLSVFSVVPPIVALVAWWTFSAIALIFLVVVLLQELTTLPRGTVIASSCALSGASCLFLEPIRSNFAFGQINIFLMLLVVFDIFRVRSTRQGLLTGLAGAVKLTPLMYIMYFVVARARASALRAVGAFLGVTAIAWVLLPADSATYWLHQAFSPGHKGGAIGPMNQSWFGLIGELVPGTSFLRTALWLLLSGFTFVMGVALAKRYVATERRGDALFVLALTELLISPISWTHHWSWIVLVPVLWLAQKRRSNKVGVAMMLLVAVAVVAPYKAHLTGWLDVRPITIGIGFSLLLSGVIVFAALALEERPWRTETHVEVALGGVRELVTRRVGGGRQDRSESPRRSRTSQLPTRDAG